MAKALEQLTPDMEIQFVTLSDIEAKPLLKLELIKPYDLSNNIYYVPKEACLAEYED